jgi:Uma2 family endonuclease
MVGEAVTRGMSASEYLGWEREQPQRYELFRGEVFAMAGGTPRHNAIAANLTVALHGHGCRVLTSDQKIEARAREHYVYADVSVVCGPAQIAEGTTDVLANPCIVAEVLSKRTESYDRGEKWASYRSIERLTDYLLVPQGEPRIEHFQRQQGGTWRFTVAQAGEAVTMADGRTVAVDDVFAGVFELPGE